MLVTRNERTAGFHSSDRERNEDRRRRGRELCVSSSSSRVRALRGIPLLSSSISSLLSAAHSCAFL